MNNKKPAAAAIGGNEEKAVKDAAVLKDASDSGEKMQDTAVEAAVLQDASDSAIVRRPEDAGYAAAPECSPCRAKNYEECKADLGCEGIPYWGESFAPCFNDERGFGNCNSGCRQAGLAETVCPGISELELTCPRYCDYNSYGLDERGCRICECGSDFGSQPIAACAIENLCASEPNASRCLDAGSPTDAAISDGSVSDDRDCLTQSYWVLQPRTISTVVRVYDGTVSALRMGATERYWVRIQLESECEMFGKLEDLGYSGDATDFVDLAASAWVPVGRDCPTAYKGSVSRVFTLEGRKQRNLRVVFTDHNRPESATQLYYENREIPSCQEQGCQCGQTTPAGAAKEGESCITDCSCAQGLSCIGYKGSDGEQWKCLRVCDSRSDCPDGQRCVIDRPGVVSLVCQSGDQCQINADCPNGFECTSVSSGKTCQDKREIPDIRVSCSCDADCRPGEYCIEGSDGQGNRRTSCEIPCNRGTDCPPGNLTNSVVCIGVCAYCCE